jgi:hypothetical protein
MAPFSVEKVGFVLIKYSLIDKDTFTNDVIIILLHYINMDIEKRFLKHYEDELPLGCVAYSDLLVFVRNLIKEQNEKKQIVHMDDNALRFFISKIVDEYFQVRNKIIDPFNTGQTESMSDKAIENRKVVMFKEIKGRMDSGEKSHGKTIFTHYLGVAGEISEEYWAFKYDILDAYYTAIGAEFDGKC